MKKTIKRYGIYGMLEQVINIHMGKATFRVHFANGRRGSEGVHPAVFTTDNYVVQYAIEHSPEFLSGHIQLIECIETDQEVFTGAEAEGVEGAKAEGLKAEGVEGDKAEGLKAEGEKVFESLEEAKQWLAQTCGTDTSNCRRPDIVRIAKSHGYAVTIKK